MREGLRKIFIISLPIVKYDQILMIKLFMDFHEIFISKYHLKFVNRKRFTETGNASG